MRSKAGTGPRCLEVQRGFEPNRLALECQARGYEEVLPVVRRRSTTTTMDTASDRGVVIQELVVQGGIAA